MSKGKKPDKPHSKKLLNEQLRRLREVRELGRRFLIVCEDDKSAKNYFDALKKAFNLSATSVQVEGSGGKTQPNQVVKKAIHLKIKAAKPDSGTDPFDEVWCVIDGDYGTKISNARTAANAKGVKLAVSTMCFEYWVLLHFAESGAPSVDCSAVITSLKKYCPQYDKGKCDFLDTVPNVRVACGRAEKLRKPGIDRGELPENQNPCSEVYKLINEILGPKS